MKASYFEQYRAAVMERNHKLDQKSKKNHFCSGGQAVNRNKTHDIPPYKPKNREQLEENRDDVLKTSWGTRTFLTMG